MGTGASSESLALAVAAVAEVTRFDLDQLRVLRQYFQLALRVSENDHADADQLSVAAVDPQSHQHSQLLRQEPNLSHAHFTRALESADCFFTSDLAIFNRFFTLLDRTGDGEILAPEFLVGVCALLSGDLVSKLQAALELLHDEGNSDKRTGEAPTSKDELAFVLITLALVASYFGDPPMIKRTALAIVDDVFASSRRKVSEAEAGESDVSPPEPESIALLPSAEAAARLAHHPLVQQYIQGQLPGGSAQPQS